MSEEGQGRQCPHCPFVATEEDLGRHIAKFHRDPSKSSAGAQKSPISDVHGQLQMPTSSVARQRFRVESISERSTSEDEESTPMDPRMVLKKMSYARAVQDMLNPNQQFDEESLMRCLADRHPEIPREHRLPLVFGTATAAQVLSQMHWRCSSFFNSDDPERRRTARGIICAFSTWNRGIIFGALPSTKMVADASSDPATSDLVSTSQPAPPSPASAVCRASEAQLVELHLPAGSPSFISEAPTGSSSPVVPQQDGNPVQPSSSSTVASRIDHKSVVSTSTTVMGDQLIFLKSPSNVITSAAVKTPRVSSTAAPHRPASVRSSNKSSTRWSPAEDPESRRRRESENRRSSPRPERSGQSVTVPREEFERLLSFQRSACTPRRKKY